MQGEQRAYRRWGCKWGTKGLSDLRCKHASRKSLCRESRSGQKERKELEVPPPLAFGRLYQKQRDAGAGRRIYLNRRELGDLGGGVAAARRRSTGGPGPCEKHWRYSVRPAPQRGQEPTRRNVDGQAEEVCWRSLAARVWTCARVESSEPEQSMV